MGKINKLNRRRRNVNFSKFGEVNIKKLTIISRKIFYEDIIFLVAENLAQILIGFLEFILLMRI
jgi:hypothetical protein